MKNSTLAFAVLMASAVVARGAVDESYDVIVAGGGPSGIGAAYMSATEGAKTLVIEQSGRLGGMAVQGMVSPFSDRGGSPYVNKIANRLGWGGTVDFERSDIRIYDMLKEAGCEVLLHTTVLGPVMDGERVTGVRVYCVDGERVIKAKVTIDCTGNGAVAFGAKVPFEMGRKSDGLVQPMSIMFTITGYDPKRRFLCASEEQSRKRKVGELTWEQIDQAEIAAGRLPPEVGVIRAYATQDRGTSIINATQVNGLFGTSSEDLTKAEITCRRQAEQIVDVMRRHLPGYENVRIAQMPAVVGVRETRRFEGVERLELPDCLSGRKFPNAIARGCRFPIDIHNPTGGGQAEGHDKSFSGAAQGVKPYDIPYGSIVPKKVEGLLFAGRCLSASHEALASCRVMGNAMATGVGAGAAAAWSVKNGCKLRDVPVAELHLFD